MQQPERRRPIVTRISHEPARQKYRDWRTRGITLLLALLTLLALAHYIAVVHSAFPTPPNATCTNLIRHTDYTKYIAWQPLTQTMGAVQFVDDLLDGLPAALIPVTDNSPQHLLDIYIYGCVLQHQTPTLTLIFKQQGLIQGTATITQTHTLSISHLDVTLAPEAAALLLPLQQNVFQEYRWSAGMFQQISFPGLYPVTSRSEAEALQDQSNNGQIQPYTDPVTTTEQMTEDILGWSANQVQGSLQDSDEKTAHVRVQQGNTSLIVTLERLIQQNDRGLWFVTTAQSSGITLNLNSLEKMPLTSPGSLSGQLTLPADSDPSTLTVTTTVFSHTLSHLPMLTSAFQVHTDGSLNGTFTYTNTVPNQPGLLLLTIPSTDKTPAWIFLCGVILG
ncbi:hypothetical protein [Tengunoibacter tsumagoiensis]|uniref:Uncharacterized protein n=1 Tax=Tengunoibacter tsumagoiensis TaxID=2014871 RepID=A0A401ZYR2_9CHLR|nr:hypothetical protein [Tengunoibacter tsumagoiensis]GCE11994.1 hypothetical protein KTT_18530 [Tengunoibacter tsumagoiensis]